MLTGYEQGCRGPGAVSGGRYGVPAAGGATGGRLPVACGGFRVATAVSLCRPRWLMDWTGTNGPSAHPERGRPGCGQLEVGSARPVHQPARAANKS